jgi:uncharacterized protein YacL
MNCYTSGLLGIGMLGATFATMTTSEDEHDKLRNVLSDDLDKIYNKIVVERRNIYFQGLIAGLIISFILSRFMVFSSMFHKITFSLGITILVSVVFYFLMPKSDYMLNHLKNTKENKAWLDEYNTMKTRYLYGFILGSLSSIPLSYAFC